MLGFTVMCKQHIPSQANEIEKMGSSGDQRLRLIEVCISESEEDSDGLGVKPYIFFSALDAVVGADREVSNI